MDRLIFKTPWYFWCFHFLCFSHTFFLCPSPLPHLPPIYPKRSIPSVKSKFADWCTLFISMKIEVALLKAALILPLPLSIILMIISLGPWACPDRLSEQNTEIYSCSKICQSAHKFCSEFVFDAGLSL